MLAAGPFPCNIGIAAPVPIPPAGAPEPEVAGAGVAGTDGDNEGGDCIDPVAGAAGPFAADAPSFVGGPAGISGIGRSAGVGVRAGGAVGWGARPPCGAAYVPDCGTICCWNVGWGTAGCVTAGGCAKVGAAMLVCPGIS